MVCKRHTVLNIPRRPPSTDFCFFESQVKPVGCATNEQLPGAQIEREPSLITSSRRADGRDSSVQTRFRLDVLPRSMNGSSGIGVWHRYMGGWKRSD